MHRPEKLEVYGEKSDQDSPYPKSAWLLIIFFAVVLLLGAGHLIRTMPPTQAGGVATNIREARGPEMQISDFLIGTHSAGSFIEASEVSRHRDETMWSVLHVRGEVNTIPSARVLFIKDVGSDGTETLLPVVNLASPVWERVLDAGSVVIAKGRIEPFRMTEILENPRLDARDFDVLTAYEGQPALFAGWTSSVSR